MSDSIGEIPLRLIEEAAERLGKLMPPETITHFLNAQREVVLGVTALIEHNSHPTTSTSRKRRTAAASRARRPRRVPVD